LVGSKVSLEGKEASVQSLLRSLRDPVVVEVQQKAYQAHLACLICLAFPACQAAPEGRLVAFPAFPAHQARVLAWEGVLPLFEETKVFDQRKRKEKVALVEVLSPPLRP